MARTKRNRMIQMAPLFCGFRPMGVPSRRGKEVVIGFEEYEALNLCDYELLTQEEAAGMMKVSRPTFTRIYESARRKVAKAFMEGSIIRFEGGQVEIAGWYRCEDCGIRFTAEDRSSTACPFCGKTVLTENNPGDENSHSSKREPS